MTPEELKKKLEQQTAALAANSNGKQPSAPAQTNNGNDGTQSQTTESNNNAQSQGSSISTQEGVSTNTSTVGPLTPEQQLEMERRIEQTAAGQNMRVNPLTGQHEYIDNTKTTLGTVIPGLRNSAAEAERINYQRSLGSALYNSMAALADMGVAIGGGNVAKRETDTTGIEAAKDTQARRDQLAQAEAAAKQRDEDILRSAAENAEKIRERFDAMRQRVSQTQSSNTGINSSTQRTQSEQKNNYNSRGGGKNGGENQITIRYRVPASGGKPEHVESIGIPVDGETYKRLGGYLSSVYNQLINDKGVNAVNDILRNAGINPKSDGTYDTDDLLRSGIIFNDPTVLSEFKNVIYATPNLSEEQKRSLISGLDTYSTIPDEEKPGWLKRKFIEWGWRKDDSPGFNLNALNGGGQQGSETGF